MVKLLGVCTRNEPVYTVMEYMLYGDLKTYLLARRHLVNERNRDENFQGSTSGYSVLCTYIGSEKIWFSIF